MPGLFDFPNPVNETSSRVVAGGVVAMASATVALDQPWVLVPLTYGFAARVLTGPKLSPLGQLATKVVTPRIPIEHHFVPGPPKRFAQAMGFVFSASALVAAYGFGNKRLAYRILVPLIAAASLEAFAGFCLGCRVFVILMRLGLISEATCEECRNIWARYPGGVAPTDDLAASEPQPAA